MVIGCLVVEVRTEGYRMLPSMEAVADMCSDKKESIKCGVSRIWVAKTQRRRGIATAMLECLRRNFLFGYYLQINDVAFSSPSEDGKALASKFFGGPQYLVYF